MTDFISFVFILRFLFSENPTSSRAPSSSSTNVIRRLFECKGHPYTQTSTTFIVHSIATVICQFGLSRSPEVILNSICDCTSKQKRSSVRLRYSENAEKNLFAEMIAFMTSFFILLLALDHSYAFISMPPPKLPSLSIAGNPLKATSEILFKIALAGAVVFCSATFQPSLSIASTAPAAQAIALEAEGRLLAEVVPVAPPKVTNKSSPRAKKIGDRLKALDAKMYGAFWCGHCNNQKANLGVPVVQQFEYIECDRDGVDSQFKVCKSKDIAGYPTWEINGELYPGEKDEGEFERLLTMIELEKIKK